MLFLNKLLPVFVLPLGLMLLLLIFALWRKKRWPVVAAILLLYLSSIPFTGQRLIGWLESRYPAVAPMQVEPADAVVVLGGIFGPQAAPGLLPNFAESGERLEAGIVLAQAGKASWLVFTGGRIPWEGRVKVEGEDSRAQAISRGVPAEKILITREVGNTADEARAVADLVRERHWRRIILVTSGWHMPRSARLFQRAGVDCIIFPVDFRRDRTRRVTLLDFLPKAEALNETETTLRELYGDLFYRFFR